MPRGDNPNSRANLKVLSPKEARKNGKKGGKASVESRAVYKSLTADLKERLTADRVAKANECLIKLMEHGNIHAYEIIRDMLGEKPKEEVNVTNETAPQVILEGFDDGRGGYE